MKNPTIANHPDVNANTYGKQFEAFFECPSSRRCKLCLCPTMPPEENDICCFMRENVQCLSLTAQVAALNSLASKIKAKVKEIEEEIKNRD